MTPRFIIGGLVVALVFLGALCPLQAQSGVDAAQVMAAFVHRFPQFVEWPASALEGRADLEICLATPDVLGEALGALVQGEELNGRQLVVRHVGDPTALEGCHLLFVSARTPGPRALLDEAARMPILTIGDGPTFLRDGGMIRLMVLDRRVRFEVNAEAASRVGLRLSSQLLALALRVREGQPFSLLRFRTFPDRRGAS